MDLPFSPQSLFLAPMEGVSREPFRLAMQDLTSGWDFLPPDFLRIPSQGVFSKAHILGHLGNKIWQTPKLKQKTYLQILTPVHGNILPNLELIHSLGVSWLDLNLGCPSKKVNGHGGGSHLLKNLNDLKKILRIIRNNFPGFFSAKIRLGYDSTDSFHSICQLLIDEGVQAITIHARTRNQMYQGKADWSYIADAVKRYSVPIIGNGDLWTGSDIKAMFDQTNCHSVMLARGALRTPWLAELYRDFSDQIDKVEQDQSFLHQLRVEKIGLYFSSLKKYYAHLVDAERLLKIYKSLSHYLFLDEKLTRQFLRSKTLDQFEEILKTYSPFFQDEFPKKLVQKLDCHRKSTPEENLASSL